MLLVSRIEGTVINMTGSLVKKKTKKGNEYYYIKLNSNPPKWIATGLETKGNKRKADQLVIEAINNYKDDTKEYNKDMLFDRYLEKWLNNRIKIEQTTKEGYQMDLDNHILPYFSSRKIMLTDLKPFHLQEYYNYLLKKGRKDGKGGLSPKSVINQNAIIGKALNDAVKDDILLYNPCKKVELPKQELFIPKFYDFTQVCKLIESSKETNLYLAVLLAVYTGCREVNC